MKDLKPCPFCGRKVEIEELNLSTTGRVFDIKHVGAACDIIVRTPIAFNADELAYNWNRRIDSET